MATDPFDSVSPEVAALFAAARATEPAAENAALFAAMAGAAATGNLGPTPSPRRKSVIGKVLTAKAAAIAGVLVMTGGVAAAATGTLPDPVQNTASDAAEHVGLHIPQGDHGADVSGVARDKSGTDYGSNHGEDVSTVARDNHGHNKDDETTSTTVAGDDNRGPGQSNGAGKSEDSHASDNARGRGGNGSDDGADHDANDDDSTSTTIANTPTTVKSDDGASHDAGDDNPGSQSGKGKNRSGRGSDD